MASILQRKKKPLWARNICHYSDPLVWDGEAVVEAGPVSVLMDGTGTVVSAPFTAVAKGGVDRKWASLGAKLFNFPPPQLAVALHPQIRTLGLEAALDALDMRGTAVRAFVAGLWWDTTVEQRGGTQGAAVAWRLKVPRLADAPSVVHRHTSTFNEERTVPCVIWYDRFTLEVASAFLSSIGQSRKRAR